MEKNNVKVQAIPSHCTMQENKEEKKATLCKEEVEPVIVKGLSRKVPGTFDKELHGELQKDEGKEFIDKMVDDEMPIVTSKYLSTSILEKRFPKSRDFDCFIKESKPGVVYVRMTGDEFKAVNLVDKVMEVTKAEFVREVKPVSVIRNLHDNIDGIEKGEVPKRAIINRQIDNFRKTVLPNYVKVGMPQLKKRAQAFIDVFGLKNDNDTLVNRITTDYFKYACGDAYERFDVFSETLGEPIDCIEKFGKYVHGNNEYIYFEFVAMFKYLCECLPTFMEGYTDRDLEYLYDEDLVETESEDSFEKIYKDLNEMVDLILGDRRLVRLQMEDFGEVYPVGEKETWTLGAKPCKEFKRGLHDPVDEPESAKIGRVHRTVFQKKNVIIGYPKGESRFGNCILRGVTVDETYNKDGLLSFCLSEDNVKTLEKAFQGNKRYLMATQHLVKNKHFLDERDACMEVVILGETGLVNTEVTLRFSDAPRFMYCNKTGALIVEESVDGYKPVLRGDGKIAKEFYDKRELATQVREVEDGELTYTKVSIRFSDAYRFKYCDKTGALMVREAVNGYEPVLEESKEPVKTYQVDNIGEYNKYKRKEESVTVKVYAKDIDTGESIIATLCIHPTDKVKYVDNSAQVYVRKVGDRYEPVLED